MYSHPEALTCSRGKSGCDSKFLPEMFARQRALSLGPRGLGSRRRERSLQRRLSVAGAGAGGDAWVLLPAPSAVSATDADARRGSQPASSVPAAVGRRASRRRISPEESPLIALVDALERRHSELDAEVDSLSSSLAGSAAPAGLKREKLRVLDRLASARRRLKLLQAPRVALGQGSEGAVCLARHAATGQLAAVKLVKTSDSSGVDRLRREAACLEAIGGACGFPRLEYCGTAPAAIAGGEKASFLCLVSSPVCGPSLEAITWECAGGGPLRPVATVATLALQAAKRVRELHGRGWMHRDLSTNNFLMGASDPNTLYLIDYGLALPLEGDLASGHADSLGTEVFAAAAVDEGLGPTAADDVESLAWVFASLLLGELPWDADLDLAARAQAKRRCAQNADFGAHGQGVKDDGARLLEALAKVAAEGQASRRERRAVAYAQVETVLEAAAAGSQPRLDWVAAGITWGEDGQIMRTN